MQRLDEGLELLLVEELDLIEEQDDSLVLLTSCLPQREKDVGEVLGEVRVVCIAFGRLDV